MPHIRIIVDGRTRFQSAYTYDRTDALREALRQNWPALLSLGRRVAVVATGDEGIAHIVARSNPYANETAAS